MNLTDAVDFWKQEKARRDETNADFKEAAKVLKDYFRRNGRTRYRGILFGTSSRRVLDTECAKAKLGDELEACMRTSMVESLSLEK